MRTQTEVAAARDAVNNAMRQPGLSDQQKTVLAGISVGLQWAAGVDVSTVTRLLAGEPPEAGKTVNPSDYIS